MTSSGKDQLKKALMAQSMRLCQVFQRALDQRDNKEPRWFTKRAYEAAELGHGEDYELQWAGYNRQQTTCARRPGLGKKGLGRIGIV